MIRHKSSVTLALSIVLVALAMAACGGAAPVASPTPIASPVPTASPPATASPVPTATAVPVTPVLTVAPSVTTATPLPATATPAAPPTPNPTPTSPLQTATPEPSVGASGAPIPTGPATLSAPDTIAAGTPFDVAWTGPNAPKDYVTIVTIGTTSWTSEPYFYTTAGSPYKLVAPTTPGAYELWYVSGTDESIATRRPITVTDFVGTLSGPPSVAAGTAFSVAWTGPDAPGDYVTLVAAGAERWTDETYFYTNGGNPGSLIAPIVDGGYELWYVAGADARTMARQPMTVSPLSITLKAPASVNKGAQFQVVWTGPNGPTDYITIVPANSPVGTYASYVYTNTGSPVTLTAPDTAGAYEIRYQSDRVTGTFASIPIKVH